MLWTADTHCGVAVCVIPEFSSLQVEAPGPPSFPRNIPFLPPPTLSNHKASQPLWCHDHAWHRQPEAEDLLCPLLQRVQRIMVGRARQSRAAHTVEASRQRECRPPTLFFGTFCLIHAPSQHGTVPLILAHLSFRWLSLEMPSQPTRQLRPSAAPTNPLPVSGFASSR